MDIDAQQGRPSGRKKQSAAFGHVIIGSKNLLKRGLNPLFAALSTPLRVPVIAASRLRGGNANSPWGDLIPQPQLMSKDAPIRRPAQP